MGLEFCFCINIIVRILLEVLLTSSVIALVLFSDFWHAAETRTQNEVQKSQAFNTSSRQKHHDKRIYYNYTITDKERHVHTEINK